MNTDGSPNLIDANIAEGSKIMRINGCEIVDVFANYDEGIGGYGDIYTSERECVEAHPDEKILHGYYVVPPEGCDKCVPDWFATYEEAFIYAATEV